MTNTDGSAPSLDQPFSSKRASNLCIDQPVDALLIGFSQFSSHLGSKNEGTIPRVKSLSMAHLDSKLDGGSPAKRAEDIRKQRYELGKKEMLNQIGMLQQQCSKFGGSEYIKEQMMRQKISQEELAKFYQQRIRSIHGFTSLPEINYRVKIGKKPQSESQLKYKKLQDVRNHYSKWYLDPEKRRAHTNEKLVEIKGVTKYVQKLFNAHNKNVVIKKQFAPLLVKQSTIKLGRQPVVCSYATIKRR